MTNKNTALIVGNSDGIGLGLTRRLLETGWQAHGLSRSVSPVKHDAYSHAVVDVRSDNFAGELSKVLSANPILCVYCVGIGEALDLGKMSQEREVMEVNLMGAVKTIEAVLPAMIRREKGHVIVLSSLADELVSAEAPSYSASKAGLSAYVEGMAQAVRDKGVAITNVRFGFVDTKMAKGDRRPMMMSVEKAVDYLMTCIEKRPVRFSRPRRMAWLVCLVRWVSRLKG